MKLYKILLICADMAKPEIHYDFWKSP